MNGVRGKRAGRKVRHTNGNGGGMVVNFPHNSTRSTSQLCIEAGKYSKNLDVIEDRSIYARQHFGLFPPEKSFDVMEFKTRQLDHTDPKGERMIEVIDRRAIHAYNPADLLIIGIPAVIKPIDEQYQPFKRQTSGENKRIRIDEDSILRQPKARPTRVKVNESLDLDRIE